MEFCQQYTASFRFDNRQYRGVLLHVEHIHAEGGTRYRAVIDGAPLHHTYGGEAGTVELALDFLNLAMQAEGADEITFTCIPLEAAG